MHLDEGAITAAKWFRGRHEGTFAAEFYSPTPEDAWEGRSLRTHDEPDA